VGAHGSIAAKEIKRPAVDDVISDFHASANFRSPQGSDDFPEGHDVRPNDLKAEHAKAALNAGVSADALTDAIAVGALFSIITRYADALDFVTADDCQSSNAPQILLLKRANAS